jgi:ABC-type xylose transport system substrate-binding protein
MLSMVGRPLSSNLSVFSSFFVTFDNSGVGQHKTNMIVLSRQRSLFFDLLIAANRTRRTSAKQEQNHNHVTGARVGAHRVVDVRCAR